MNVGVLSNYELGSDNVEPLLLQYKRRYLKHHRDGVPSHSFYYLKAQRQLKILSIWVTTPHALRRGIYRLVTERI